MNIQFTGKSVLVTGAARGIGRAVALAFARDGANVLVNTRNEQTLEDVYAACCEASAGGRIEKYLADVGDVEQNNAMIDYMIEKFGGIDILVTNAAAEDHVAFLKMDYDVFERAVMTNFRGVVFLNQKAAKNMIRRNVPGRIINFSSIGAAKPHRLMTPYDSTKAGIEGITRAAAVELAPFGITVNAIAPACVRRDNTLNTVDDRPKQAKYFEQPMLRWGEPEDVAWLIEFLASEYAGFITGDVIPIDGGMAIQARSMNGPSGDFYRIPEPANLEAFISSGELKLD